MLKKIIMIISLLLFFSVSAFSWSGEATEDAKAYENQKREMNADPVFELSAGDQVEVLEGAGNKYKIEHYSGKVGWVNKSKIDKAQNIGNKLQMSGEQVKGSIGEIEAVYVFEDEAGDMKGLKVERSFKDEMKAPVDKENMERKNTEYIKW